MGTKTKIPWCEATWNPVVGCTKISPGCKNCYAETMAKRLKAMGQKKYQDVVDKDGWTGKIGIGELKCFNEPMRRQKKTLYFVGSMGDLFHKNVPEIYLDHIFDRTIECTGHIFIILTKRPQRMRDYLESVGNPCKIRDHIWLGVTVESDDYRERIDDLLSIPAAVHFVSVEPMLGPVDLGDHIESLDWVIIGGESGRKRRTIDFKYAQDLIDQCRAAGVPVFLKQWDFKDGKRLQKAPFVDRENYMEYPG